MSNFSDLEFNLSTKEREVDIKEKSRQYKPSSAYVLGEKKINGVE